MPQTINLGPCACCGAGVDPPECEFCGGADPPANFYVLGLSGITDSGCTDCEDYNEDPLELQYSGTPCEWAWTGTGGCTGEEPTLVVNSDGSATLTIGGATYEIASFDCDGVNVLTLDSAGTDCDDWPNEIEVVPGQIEDTCDGCASAAAAQYEVTFSGVTDNTCNDSANLNGSHIVTFEDETVGDCVWGKTLTLCGDANAELDFTILSGGVWILHVRINGDNRASYAGGGNCLQQQTLTQSSSTNYYNFPATITVAPV